MKSSVVPESSSQKKFQKRVTVSTPAVTAAKHNFIKAAATQLVTEFAIGEPSLLNYGGK
jgi:hypothetical protein